MSGVSCITYPKSRRWLFICALSFLCTLILYANFIIFKISHWNSLQHNSVFEFCHGSSSFKKIIRLLIKSTYSFTSMVFLVVSTMSISILTLYIALVFEVFKVWGLSIRGWYILKLIFILTSQYDINFEPITILFYFISSFMFSSQLFC